MLNNIESYQEAGRRAAQALNQKDIDRWRFEVDHARKMLALESPEDRALARRAFHMEYHAHR